MIPCGLLTVTADGSEMFYQESQDPAAFLSNYSTQQNSAVKVIFIKFIKYYGNIVHPIFENGQKQSYIPNQT